MAQTYAELQDQITRLQTEAQQLRQQELATVIAQMRADIKVYEITPHDLFGKISSKAPANKANAAVSAKYADGNGNSWVGRGPRPRWLRDALAVGKKLEDFLPGAPVTNPEPAVTAKPVKAAAKRATVKKAAAKKPKGSAAK